MKYFGTDFECKPVDAELYLGNDFVCSIASEPIENSEEYINQSEEKIKQLYEYYYLKKMK